MKLHINTTETKTGFLFKKPAWQMDSRIELSPEEERVLAAHPEIKKMTLASGTFIGDMTMDCSVAMFLGKGMTGSTFTSLANQTTFEQASERDALVSNHTSHD